MKTLVLAAAVSAIMLASLPQAAHAAKLCKLTGTYDDEYGIATATIMGSKGKLVAPEVCSTPYTFKITDETQTGFTVTGKNKTKSCGDFTADATFGNSCSVFSVSGMIHGMEYSDTFTKQAKIAHRAPAGDDGLSRGLK